MRLRIYDSPVVSSKNFSIRLYNITMIRKEDQIVMLLNIFPTICDTNHYFLTYCCMCINNDVPSFSRSKYAYTAVVLNLVCLLIYLTDVILNVIFLSWRVFWTLDGNAWNRYASFSDSSILCAMSRKGLIFGLNVKVSVCVWGGGVGKF